MKAVIMAGGEGSRLRPLTCNVPKPMAKICGKPTLEYILDLLDEHGFDEAAVTLRYLPQEITSHFEDGKYKNISLKFVTEDTPLGTAGGVKNAAEGFDEDFLVISGDAICDFDLSGAMRSHKESGSDVTILVTRVDDPREYGLVTVGENDLVTGFVEKPSWSGVTTNMANTGIYIINPSVLSLIPSDRSFDFASNLFPLMLSKNKKLSACELEGYWCDIGDLTSFLKCQEDVLSKRVQTTLAENPETGCFGTDTVPEGNYKIFPPVYFGKQVKIGDGAVIGPNTVLDDGVTVEKNARIRASVIMPDSFIGDGARLTGAIVCSGAKIQKGVSLFEGTTIGSGAVVEDNAEVLGGVSVWPEKRIEASATVRENIKYGTAKSELFDDDGISGEAGVDMTPEFCAMVGAAAGSLSSGRKIGIGCGGGNAAKAFKAAISSGVLSTGAQVWDFGQLMEAQMIFAASFCGIDVGLYVVGGEKCSIKVIGNDGLPASRALERELQKHLQKGEFIRCGWSGYRDAADMNGIKLLYQQELYRQAPHGLAGTAAKVSCAVKEGERLFEDTLCRLGCDTKSGISIHLSKCGTKISATDESGDYIPYDKLLAICCITEFEQGNDVALPYDSPRMIDALAQKYNCKVYRYISSPTDSSDKRAREMAKSQYWFRDGMMMAVKLLDTLKEKNVSLSSLAEKIPAFAVVTRSYELNDKPANIMRVLGVEYENVGDGVLINREGANLLLRPRKHGKSIRLLAEAANNETAESMCDDIEAMLSKLLDNGK